ncbi:MAG: clostripain-related cysteine peptidase, partial [Thermoplasmata archaeon]
IYCTDALGNTGSSTVRQFTTLAANNTSGPVRLQLDVWTEGTLASNGEKKEYYVDISTGNNLTVTLDGPDGVDFDLYVKKGSVPTTSSYDAKGTTSSPDETCKILNPSGTYYIMVLSYSGSGIFKIKASVGAVATDTTPPVVSIASPSAGAVVSGNITVSFAATDASGIAEYRLEIDSTLKATSSPYIWDTRTSSNGIHTITVKAKDGAGNWGQMSLNVSVNNNATGVSEWTFAVVLAGDNSLSTSASDDFAEMKAGFKAAAEGMVNILVLYDSSRSGDTKIYKIGANTASNISNSQVDSSFGSELNTADPAVLLKFIKWVYTTYPSRNFGLILWGNGNGWRGFLDDSTSSAAMYPASLRSVVSGVYNTTGRPMDLVIFDMSFMAMTELMLEINTYVKYAVASEKEKATAGLPYSALFEYLTNNTTTSPSEFANTTVSKYIAAYSSASITLSSSDLSRVSNLKSAVDNLAYTLRNVMGTQKQNINSAISSTEKYGSDYYDLWHLASCIKSKVSVTDVSNAATGVMNAVSSFIMQSSKNGTGTTNAHGVSIYLGSSYNSAQYSSSLLSQQTLWNELLSDLFATTIMPSITSYHTYSSLGTELNSLAASHPDIMKVSVIGKSVNNRNIYAVKVSDNVNTSENSEPDVVYTGGIHGNEKQGVEMCMFLLHYLVDNYGINATLTNYVNSFEIWFIPMLNPDGNTNNVQAHGFQMEVLTGIQHSLSLRLRHSGICISGNILSILSHTIHTVRRSTGLGVILHLNTFRTTTLCNPWRRGWEGCVDTLLCSPPNFTPQGGTPMTGCMDILIMFLATGVITPCHSHGSWIRLRVLLTPRE